jgi:hypothetical protein
LEVRVSARGVYAAGVTASDAICASSEATSKFSRNATLGPPHAYEELAWLAELVVLAEATGAPKAQIVRAKATPSAPERRSTGGTQPTSFWRSLRGTVSASDLRLLRRGYPERIFQQGHDNLARGHGSLDKTQNL